MSQESQDGPKTLRSSIDSCVSVVSQCFLYMYICNHNVYILYIYSKLGAYSIYRINRLRGRLLDRSIIADIHMIPLWGYCWDKVFVLVHVGKMWPLWCFPLDFESPPAKVGSFPKFCPQIYWTFTVYHCRFRQCQWKKGPISGNVVGKERIKCRCMYSKHFLHVPHDRI